MKKSKTELLRYCTLLFLIGLFLLSVSQVGYAATSSNISFKTVKMTDSNNGKAYYSDGTLAYEGGIISDLPSGKGKLYTIKGKLLYDGQFKAGKLQGKGELYDNETGYLSMQGTFDAVIDNLDNSDVKKIKFIGNFKGTGFTGSNKTRSFEGTLTGNFDSYGGNVKIKGKYYNTGDNDIVDISLSSKNYQNLEFSGQVYENDKLMLDGSMKATQTDTKKSCTIIGKMYLTQKDLNGDNNSDSATDKEENNNFNGQLYVDGKKFLDGNMTINKPKGSTESKTSFTGSFYQDGKLLFKGKLDDSGMTGSCKLYYSNGKLMYDGQMKNSLMNGTGKLYDEKGKLLHSGKFKDGKPVK